MPKKIDLTGQRFGKLVAIREATNEEKRGQKGVFWYCLCDCGGITVTRTQSLRSGNTQSCGCYNKQRVAETQHKTIIDMTGQKFGRLTVLSYDKDRLPGVTAWWCKCDCGNIKSILRDSLISGKVQSCGCFRKEKISNYAKLSSRYIDETGNTYGYLTVLRKATYEDDGFIRKYGGVWWVCQCKCGNIVIVSSNSLRTNNTKSCGCIKSKGELEIEKILIENNIDFKTQFKIKYDYALNDTHVFKFDFAVCMPTYFYCIEYDGKQHYEPVEYFGGEKEYLRIKQMDKMKNDYCVQHHIPLIRIPYTIKNKIVLDDLIPETSMYLL